MFDTVVSRDFAKDRVFFSKAKIAVDFVRDDKDIVTGGQFRHLVELVAVPDATDGIVRAAKDEDFRLFHLLF